MVSHMTFEGDVSMVFQAQDIDANRASLVGIHFGFLNPPDVGLDLKKLDGARDWSQIDGKTRHIVNSIFRNVLVLPQHFSVRLSSGEEQRSLVQAAPRLPRAWLAPAPCGL